MIGSQPPRGADAPRKNLRYFFLVACGAAACVVLISVLRTLWYEWMVMRPQMSPRMFILFSPILAAAYATVALVCEGLLALLAPSFTGARPFAVGASYGLLFIGLIRPELWVVLAVANPLVLHAVLWNRRRRALRGGAGLGPASGP
ncbi:hypothetical protein [Lysobacter enzymogenes]|uniref:Uncharacterized protein n=1 Tax=Lysobacter enzymogenes TaxID=69 RepID=A0A3N2RKT1_LYSEN|nr:hypothetical protein [Lysobacter enzymogenes]ROU08088.1 hypothetical protein D9T17_05910 [Lysobacter enzymogenes]